MTVVVPSRAEPESPQEALRASQAHVCLLEAMVASLQEEARLLRLVNAELEARVRVVPELTEKLDAAQREIAELKRRLIGRTTERSGPRPKKDPPRPSNDAGAQQERKKHREERRAVAEEVVPHPLPAEVLQKCPDCGHVPLTRLPPEESIEYEWKPGRLVRLVHQQERALCERCKGFARASAPPRVVDGGLYGPGFISRVVVQKVLDCVPLYRQSKMFAREGLTVARSTLLELFHRAASLVEPLYKRMLEQIPESRVVYADETSLKMQRVKKLGYIWTFATTLFITYVFSPSRSGKTPVLVLGDSPGMLVVDGYTGYNEVTLPGKRERAGCGAHARRKFTNIDDDGARHVIELYKGVFEVEREAKERGIAGTPEHLALRRDRAGPVMAGIKAWCEEHRGQYAPKSPMGEAIRYFINQWKYLVRFLDDVEVDPSNNLSERLLRTIALGRRNYLFVGHEDAGRNLAMLASIVQTCVLHDVDPQRYLADVLIRVQSHPAAAIDDLLPHRWRERFGRDDERASA